MFIPFYSFCYVAVWWLLWEKTLQIIFIIIVIVYWVVLLCVYSPVFVRLRHANRQHGGVRPAEGGFAQQRSRSHAEETPPPEREKAQQSHPSSALLCRHREETFWPALAWKKRWDTTTHSHFFLLRFFTTIGKLFLKTYCWNPPTPSSKVDGKNE